MIDYLEYCYKGNILRGMLHRGISFETIIIVHGYLSSNKIGPYRLYFEIAEHLRKKGFTVVRIDLSGMGESDGDIQSVDFEDHVNELLSLIDYIRELLQIDTVHLLGHCIGCSTVLKCYKLAEKYISSVILLAPFYPSKLQFIKFLGSENTYNMVLEKGLAYRNGYPFKKSYLSAADMIKDTLLLERVRTRLKIFISGRDVICSSDDMEVWCYKNNLEYEIIDNADHNYIDRNSRLLLLKKIERWYLQKEYEE